MTNTIYIKAYEALPHDTGEILRYSGARDAAPDVVKLMQECLDEVKDKLIYKVCYAELPINVCGGYIDLSFVKTDSSDLNKNLKNCDSVVLFAATVGIEIDRLIAKYSRVSPSKALMLQAIGAERIETLCNAFDKEIAEQMQQTGKHTRPRFSPGYGDLPLDIQRDIFRVLDCPRKIGLSLNESLLMSPSKSVTAIIGIAEDAVESK